MDIGPGHQGDDFLVLILCETALGRRGRDQREGHVASLFEGGVAAGLLIIVAVGALEGSGHMRFAAMGDETDFIKAIGDRRHVVDGVEVYVAVGGGARIHVAMGTDAGTRDEAAVGARQLDIESLPLAAQGEPFRGRRQGFFDQLAGQAQTIAPAALFCAGLLERLSRDRVDDGDAVVGQ